MIASLSMLALSFLLGRFFCGWICPLGAVNDWTARLGKKKNLPDSANKRIRKIKYVILALVFVAALFGFQLAWVLDPLVITARFVSLNLIPAVTFFSDKTFIALIQALNLYESPVYDLYRQLKGSFLAVDTDFFASAWLIFLYFILVIAGALVLSRAWCRLLCPLGAIYGLTAKVALLERSVGACSGCSLCAGKCRMGAIRKDAGYEKSECVLCMDCVYQCPKRQTTFGWRKSPTRPEPLHGAVSPSRKQFLVLLAASAASLLLSKKVLAAKKPIRPVIRPPGSLREEEFLDRCIRCGNCMKVCVTNGLQPVFMESGLEGIWTPRLVPRIGPCEYNCALCGGVCPTQAIPKLPLAVKQKARLGVARIHKPTCLAWGQNKDCIVCEEHCPVATKAIKTDAALFGGRTVLRPVVDEALCIGCGLCENVCPVDPIRAIRVFP